MKLRNYQEAAVACIFKEWQENDSTLCVMPTGCGKTQVFAEIIKRSLPKRAIVLVHREELARQAMKRIEGLGISTSTEMADMRASTDFWNQSPVIISTIQTQISVNSEGIKRMKRFDPNDFGVLIVDEAHHATSDSWVEVINYYRQNPNLRVLGVTATPDRLDEEALGKVFKTVAYDYEVLDAIHDGWLVPIQQQMVSIDGLDFSHIKTSDGDLNGTELAAIMEMESVLQGVVSASIDLIGNRRTLVFAVRVKQAEIYANIFNRHRPGMAEWVSGKTPKDKRQDMLKRFDEGEIQVMINVGVLTEGFDSPGVEVIVQAKPTKSRALYSQMIGRATRPIPGIVDKEETPEARRNAIRCSIKPSMLVIDFVGNSGRHKLVTTADILGGKFTDKEIEIAEYAARQYGGAVDMTEELEKARRELEEKRLEEIAKKVKLKAKATFSSKLVSPFDVFELQPERERGWDLEKKLSEKQTAMLLKQGVDPSGYTYTQCKQLINEMFRRFNNNLCSLKQAKILKKRGISTEISREAASKIITEIAAREGWGGRR